LNKPKELLKNLNIVHKNVSLKLLSEKIQDFLKNNINDYDYYTFKIELSPDERSFNILIDYGYVIPTTKMFVNIEGEPNNFRIYEYKTYRIAPYTTDVWMEEEYAGNELVFHNKLWNFIEQSVTLLENSINNDSQR